MAVDGQQQRTVSLEYYSWIATKLKGAEERGTTDQVPIDDGPGLPLPETLKELDLDELIPVVERIKAERGLAAATS